MTFRFSEATFDDSVDYVRSLFRSHIPGSNAWLSPNNFEITAITLGGVLHVLSQEHRAGIDARVMPDTAIGADLDRIAKPYGIIRRAGTAATGIITLKGTDGTTIPEGATFEVEDGRALTSSTEAVIAEGVARVPAAYGAAGGAGNYYGPVRLRTTIGGADTEAVADIFGGTDTETDQQLRERLFAYLRGPTRFNSLCDLEAFIRLYPGVSDVWLLTRNDGIHAYVLWDGQPPTPEQRAELQARLDDPCHDTGRNVAVMEVEALTLDVMLQCPCPLEKEAAILGDLQQFTGILNVTVEVEDVACVVRKHAAKCTLTNGPWRSLTGVFTKATVSA